MFCALSVLSSHRVTQSLPWGSKTAPVTLLEPKTEKDFLLLAYANNLLSTAELLTRVRNFQALEMVLKNSICFNNYHAEEIVGGPLSTRDGTLTVRCIAKILQRCL